MAVWAEGEEATRLHEQVEQLQAALESRVVVEQAKGILAERFRLEIPEAFALLRYSARAAQVRIHDLAKQTVSRRETPPAILVGLSRRRRWSAAAQRELAGAHRARAAELGEKLKRHL